MAFADMVWQLIGTQQFGNILLILLLGKIIDYDINMANIIQALNESDEAPDVRYQTIFPVKLPRFVPRKVKKK